MQSPVDDLRAIQSRAIHAIVCCALPVTLGACVSGMLNENLAELKTSQGRELANLASDLDQKQRIRISWTNALARMEENNAALAQSRRQLELVHRQSREQWLTLIPTFSSFVSVGENITELSNISSSNINANLVANLTIPNPFEFHAALYAIALQKQNAIWSHELDRRRAHIELYSVFLEERQIQRAEAEVVRMRRGLEHGTPGEIANLFRRIRNDEAMIERRRDFHRLRVNQILNSPGENWEPHGRLPTVTYRDRHQEISMGERFGKLALNLQTIQIESSILQVRRVKFRQWPNFNFSLSAPPLLSTNDGASFSSDQLLFFTSAQQTVLPADPGGRVRIRDAETRLQFTREQLRSRMEGELVRLKDGQRNYQRLLQEERSLERQIRSLNRPASGDIQIVLRDLELLAEAKSNLERTQSMIQQMELQFLIWDEAYWKNL